MHPIELLVTLQICFTEAQILWRHRELVLACAYFRLSHLSNFPPKECIMVQHTSQIHNDNCNLLSSH